VFTLALPRGGEADIYPGQEGGCEVYAWSRDRDSGYRIGSFRSHAEAVKAVTTYIRATYGEVLA
jgi:hypothetical protein